MTTKPTLQARELAEEAARALVNGDTGDVSQRVFTGENYWIDEEKAVDALVKELAPYFQKALDEAGRGSS